MLFYSKNPLGLIIKPYRGLRGYALLKIPTLVAAWAGITLYMPLVYTGKKLDPTTVLFGFIILSWLVSNALVFDLRDYKRNDGTEKGNFFANFSFSTGFSVALGMNLLSILPFLLYAPVLSDWLGSAGYKPMLVPAIYLIPNLLLLFMLLMLKAMHGLLKKWGLYFFLADIVLCIPWILQIILHYGLPEIPDLWAN